MNRIVLVTIFSCVFLSTALVAQKPKPTVTEPKPVAASGASTRGPGGLALRSYEFDVVTVTAPVSRAPAASKPSLEGLDEFIVERTKEWNVPGLAIAIVRDGKVIHSKGYGFRDVERKLPVTFQAAGRKREEHEPLRAMVGVGCSSSTSGTPTITVERRE